MLNLKTTDDNHISFLECTVDKNHVNCHSESFHLFHFQHGALQTARIQQAVVEQILSQLAQKEQQVRYALSGNRGSWHERNRFPEILCIKQNIKVTEGMLK